MSKTSGGNGGGDGQRGPNIEAARDKRELPRRFYTAATIAPVEDGYGVMLDGRPVRTPQKHALAVPHRALAEAIAGEWQVQAAHIDPATMPLTRIVNAALDAVAGEMAAVVADIVAFAGSDLLCYREAGDERLAARQRLNWDSMLAWAAARLDARLKVTSGLMPVAQPPEALEAIAREVARLDALGLAALHVMTTLTGSAVLALGTALGAITPEEAWGAAHLDEDFQIELWGADAEASARRKARHTDFTAAARILALTERGRWPSGG